MTAGAAATGAMFPDLAAALERAAPVGRAPIIRTLLGDLAPAALGDGAVLMHEHLSMRYPLNATEHFTDDVGMMVDEARAAKANGVACIVDGGHADMSRKLDALRRISRESGLPIVASGGWYMQRSYPPELSARSAEQLAGELAAEARREGYGAFGEIGQQGGVLTADERKVFEAVGRAHVLTGLPIFTHNPYTGIRESDVPREAALRQLEILLDAGARPESIAIGHVCCLDDPNAEIAIEIASRGAFVAFDRVTLNGIIPDEMRVKMAMAFIEAGHADRFLLSSDFASRSALASRGGPGLAQTVTVFGPMLLEAGLPQATLDRILEDNPRRFLAFEPRG